MDVKSDNSLPEEACSKWMGGGRFVWELSLCCLSSEKYLLKSWTFWLKDRLPAGNTCPEKNLGQECLRKMQKCSSLFWIRKWWKRKMLHGDRIFLWRRKYWSLVIIPGFWCVGVSHSLQCSFIRVSSPPCSNLLKHSLLSLWSMFPIWTFRFQVLAMVPHQVQWLLPHLTASVTSIKYYLSLVHLFRPWLLTWNSCKGFLRPFQGIASVV